MNNETYNVEDIKKRFEDLDSGLNAFLQSVKEIKEIRDTVGELPEKIRSNDERIEMQKKEIEQLMSSANNVFISFEEKSKGVIFDIEKKTEALTNEVKSGISQIGNMFEQGNMQLQDRQKENSEALSRKFEELRSSLEEARKSFSRHEAKMDDMETNYMDSLKIFDRLEQSFEEMKKSFFIFQKKPYVLENKITEIDERLTALIHEKYARQKAVTWILFLIVMLSIAVSFSVFYFGLN